MPGLAEAEGEEVAGPANRRRRSRIRKFLVVLPISVAKGQPSARDASKNLFLSYRIGFVLKKSHKTDILGQIHQRWGSNPRGGA